MVVYVCLNIKVLKSAYTFRTKISDSIKNSVHHGENQPCQEVGGGYLKKSDACGALAVEPIHIVKNTTL